MIFRNGDRLSGTVVGVNETEVVFENPLLGTITVPADAVTIELGPKPETLAVTQQEPTQSSQPMQATEPTQSPTELVTTAQVASDPGSSLATEPVSPSDQKSSEDLMVLAPPLPLTDVVESASAPDEATASDVTKTAEAQTDTAATTDTAEAVVAENTAEDEAETEASLWTFSYQEFREFTEQNEVVEFLETTRDFFKELIPDGWHGRVSAGFNVTRTRNESRQLNLRGRVEKTWNDNLRFKLTAHYNYRETEDNRRQRVITNQDDYGGDAGIRYDFYDPFFFDFTTEYKQDRIRELDHDVLMLSGVGLRILDLDGLEFNVLPRIGPEYRESVVIEDNWILLYGITNEVKYRINRILSVEQEAYYDRDFSDDRNYRYGLEARLIIRITKWLDAVARYETEFDNRLTPRLSQDKEQLVFSIGIPF